MREHVLRNDIEFTARCLLLALCAAFTVGAAECLAAEPDPVVTVSLNLNQTAEAIRNIGSSGCWYSEDIGRYWPQVKKERIAEQGDESGIRDADRRVECFLDADGNYDWSKQAGYLWFVQQAQAYGVEDLIAFSNTPPVFFTQNGYGFKTEADGLSNLRPDRVEAFAAFLATVVKHFDEQGLHFDYLSPVNEPQWNWNNRPGRASQEGCPWQNEEVFQVVKALDEALAQAQLDTEILVPEAAKLNFLYRTEIDEAGPGRSNQIAAFWDPDSPLYLGGFDHICRYLAGHSYFTDNGDEQLISIRHDLAEAVAQGGQDLEYWQSEYSLLGDGYRDGRQGRLSEMDHALFLAKVIHHDFVVGQATAWQYWNAYEPGRASSPRYYLIALTPNDDRRDGEFAATKCLWALGHYSRFLRPGMKRLLVERSDGLTDEQAAQQLMISAFADLQTGRAVAVIINYRDVEATLKIDTAGFPASDGATKLAVYSTSADPDENMKARTLDSLNGNLVCPGRSIMTVLF